MYLNLNTIKKSFVQTARFLHRFTVHAHSAEAIFLVYQQFLKINNNLSSSIHRYNDAKHREEAAAHHKKQLNNKIISVGDYYQAKKKHEATYQQ